MFDFPEGYMCDGDDGLTMCNSFSHFNEHVHMPLQGQCVRHVKSFMKTGDRVHINNTDFRHLVAYMETGNECPRVRLAFMWAPEGWNVERVRAEGIDKFFTSVLEFAGESA